MKFFSMVSIDLQWRPSIFNIETAYCGRRKIKEIILSHLHLDMDKYFYIKYIHTFEVYCRKQPP